MPFSADEENAESKLAAELIAERRSDSVDLDTIEQCPECRGARLNPIARAVQVQGYTIDQVTAAPINRAHLAREKLEVLRDQTGNCGRYSGTKSGNGFCSCNESVWSI